MLYNIENINHLKIVRDITKKYKIDLRTRLLYFAVNAIQFLKTIPNNIEYDVIRYQFSKSATAIGANYEETQSTSIKEFLQKIKISLREANESKYWLKIIESLKIGDLAKLKSLSDEVTEISLILGSIASKVDKKIKSEGIK